MNNNDETPFYNANRNNHKEIAKYLLDKKEKLKIKTHKKVLATKLLALFVWSHEMLFVLNSCGYTSLCEPCSYNLITNHTHPKCPTCRKPVRDYTKIFFQVPE